MTPTFINSETPIQDQIDTAAKEAHESGRRITLHFDKAELLRQNPEAAADPRMQLISQDIVRIDFDVNEEITVGELRKLCYASKSALARRKASEIANLPKTMLVTLLKQDIMDIREGNSIAMANGVTLDNLPTDANPTGTLPLDIAPRNPEPDKLILPE